MAISDFIRNLTGRNKPHEETHIVARPAAGSLETTGALALNDDEGLADKITTASVGVEPTDHEDQQQEDQEPEQQPEQSLADSLRTAIAGHPSTPADSIDLDSARRVVVPGDRSMDLPVGIKTKTDAGGGDGNQYNAPVNEPTEAEQQARQQLEAEGERGQVSFSHGKDLQDLFENLTRNRHEDDLIEKMMKAIDEGGVKPQRPLTL